MRDLTEEELKWVSPEQFKHCDCMEIECPICNLYMPADVAAGLFEKIIADAIRLSKEGEKNRLRYLEILGKPESERTSEEKNFITMRMLLQKAEESLVKQMKGWINRASAFEIAGAGEGSEVKFKRPKEYKSGE